MSIHDIVMLSSLEQTLGTEKSVYFLSKGYTGSVKRVWQYLAASRRQIVYVVTFPGQR